MLIPRKKILSFNQTLYRRTDASFYEQAQEELQELMDDHSQYIGASYYWVLKMEESSHGSFARLNIDVYHPTDRDYSALFYLALVLTILTVLSGFQLFFEE